MQRAILSARFPLNRLTRRISIKRLYATGSDISPQIRRGQNATLLLAGTALLGATSGYLLATYECQRSKLAEGIHTSGPDHQRYGSAKDFREAIEELKATFPKPGAVSDDPEVLVPYGFTDNDHHPGYHFFCILASSRAEAGVFSIKPHRCRSPAIY